MFSKYIFFFHKKFLAKKKIEKTKQCLFILIFPLISSSPELIPQSKHILFCIFLLLGYLVNVLQPKWNNALLEMFRIDYVGNSPYITCLPYLKHHRLGPKDKFLILCSDGLYQYLSNEEAVAEVELFITLQPEGDPAQHLVEEVLFRAAKKAGTNN